MNNLIFSTRNIDDFISDVADEVIKKLELWKIDSKQSAKSLNNDLLTVKDAAQFLHLTVPTVYSKVSRGELPVMKRSKRLYFSREDLMEYIRVGRKKTNSEIEVEAGSYLKKKGGHND
ncbi:MAG: helix-turn-helix domain-containing protein [Bacteroidales bacterium]|nr:helix-turn-helix domain-containing protein [Bacteroidales bacterium]